MKLLKYFVLPIIVMSSVNLYSQTVNTAKSWEFHTGIPASNIIYQARDFIELNPTMSISASQNMVFELNENLIYDADYQSYQDPNPSSRELSFDLPAGSTQGNLNVSRGGAANYSIPIIIAPGTAGVQPSLAIAYNSQGGNNVLGIGWGLAGISAITRSGQSEYYDGNHTEVKLTSSDRFYLDGQRIVHGGPYAYGASYAHYLENYDYSKITPMGSAGTGPAYFIVEKKDGTKVYYGKYDNTDAYIKSSSNSTIVAWYIAKIVDRKGNYIRYKYTKDETNGETWLKQIEYTGNAGESLDPYNSIDIYYQIRDDVSTSYIAGCKFTHSKIVRKIKSFCEGKLVREYIPKYVFDEKTKLNEIEEYNAKGERYNSIVVGWGTKSNLLSSAYSQTTSFNEGISSFGDFNGDGISDFIHVYPEGGNFVWQARIGRYHGISAWFDGGTIPGSGLINVKFVPGDFDGDGLDEVLVIKYQSAAIGSAELWETNGSTFVKTGYFSTANFGAMHIQVGDFDGDGQDEYARTDGYGSIYIDDFNGDMTNPPSTSFSGLNSIDIPTVYDWNADGKDDMILTETNIEVYNGGRSTAKIFESTFGVAGYNLYYGYFNSDNLLDVLIWRGSGLGWSYYINNGTGLNSGVSINIPNVNTESDPENNNIFISDVDGDKTSDIIYGSYSSATNNCTFQFYTDITGIKGQYTESINGIKPAKFYIKAFNDFNGDGNVDILVHDVPTSGYLKIFLIRKESRDKFVTKILNGFNVSTDITYETLALSTSYTKGQMSSFPLSDYIGPLYVVEGVTKSKNLKTVINNSYTYGSAIVHRQGKGFLGFRIFETTDELTNIKTYDSYYAKKKDGKYAFVPQESLVRHGATNFITRNYYTVDMLTYNDYGKRFAILLKETSTIDYLKDILVSNTYSNFTSNGDPQTIVTRYARDPIANQHAGITEATNTTTISYWPSGSPYLPASVSTVYHRTNGTPDITRSKTISYTSDHQVEVMKTDPGTNFELWESYAYDDYGNTNQVKITDSNSNVLRIVDFTYDSKYRFLTSSQNALGHKIVYNHDPKTGNIVRTKNAQGVVTLNDYDAFGRMTLSSSALHNNKISYIWSTDNNIDNELYCIKSEQKDYSYSKVYFDAFGRKVHERGNPMQGTSEINVAYKYNPKGWIEAISEPYDDILEREFENYEYDEFGRITRIHSYKSDILTTYSTSERRKVTQTNADATDHTSWIKTNSLGEIVEASDPGGTISYSYNAVGLPNEIVSPGNISTTMSYYLNGHQEYLIDPNRGTTHYEYDLLGQLTKQTDANGEIYNLIYDDLGRMKTISNSKEGTTTYNYVSSGYGLGQIASITNQNQSKSFEYDKYGRTNSQVITITGQTNPYTYNYIYGYDGKLETLEYPGDFSISYKYNGYGALVEVKDAQDQSIWKITDMYDFGSIERIEYGNGLATTFYFDQYKQLSDISTKKSTQYIQHLEYDFNNITNNLTSRSDLLANSGNGITETFQYDELDRMTDYSVSTSTFSLDYYSNGTGNYEEKSDIGTYNFVNSNHAVSSITGSSGDVIDTEELEITYTAFNKVKKINKGNFELNFTYGVNNERIITELLDNTTAIKTKLYIGDLYEIEIDENNNKRHLYYVPGPLGEASIFERINSGTGQMYYLHKDHLGSYHTISDENGDVVETLSFDPWGRRRNSDNWGYASLPTSFLFDRGFTGHEALDEFDLINMNGRVFDPLAAQFLSPDIIIQNPGFTQSYNRYSYAFNNPMKYTDPSGYSFIGDLLDALMPGSRRGNTGGSNVYRKIREEAVTTLLYRVKDITEYQQRTLAMIPSFFGFPELTGLTTYLIDGAYDDDWDNYYLLLPLAFKGLSALGNAFHLSYLTPGYANLGQASHYYQTPTYTEWIMSKIPALSNLSGNTAAVYSSATSISGLISNISLNGYTANPGGKSNQLVPTIINNSDQPVFFLTEYGHNVGSLGPGGVLYDRIEGVGTKFSKTEVFKVAGNEAPRKPGTIIVNENGDVTVTSSWFLRWFGSNGWKNRSYFNDWDLNENNWGRLYDLIKLYE